MMLSITFFGGVLSNPVFVWNSTSVGFSGDTSFLQCRKERRSYSVFDIFFSVDYCCGSSSSSSAFPSHMSGVHHFG